MIDTPIPDHIKHVISLDENIFELRKFLNDDTFRLEKITTSPYIEIDLNKMSFKNTLVFTWLYRTEPKTYTTNEIKSMVRKEKIERICK